MYLAKEQPDINKKIRNKKINKKIRNSNLRGIEGYPFIKSV